MTSIKNYKALLPWSGIVFIIGILIYIFGLSSKYQILRKDMLKNVDGNVTHLYNLDAYEKDNISTAAVLYENVKILVIVFTQPENLRNKATAVKETWGKRANKLLFANDNYIPTFPTIPINVSHGREYLTLKIQKALDYVYKNYAEEYDWFMKCDDDSYIIMENLRYYLSNFDPEKPYFLGQLFKAVLKEGIYAGGAGMILSRETLRIYAEGHEKSCKVYNSADDVELPHCLQKLGLKMHAAYDKYGKTMFHCFTLKETLKGDYPKWYYRYDPQKGKLSGVANMSEYTISFHYITPDEMYQMDFLTHHLRLYGVKDRD